MASAVEFINEPNYEMWPQDTGDTNGYSVCLATAMFSTAQGVASIVRQLWGGGSPLMAGPATADIRQIGTKPHQYSTQYAEFTTSLAQNLKNAQFADAGFLWSHHNYGDFLYDRGPDSITPKSLASNPADHSLHAATVRDILATYQWRGRPCAQAGQPTVWLTEGGANRNLFINAWPNGFNGIFPSSGAYTASQLDAIQQQLVQRAYQRLANDLSGGGLGIAMFTNWLTYSATDLDSGLADPIAIGQRARPVYFTWKGLPSVQ